MKLQAFTFGPSLSLRVIERDGEPWFVAKDVCDALGADAVNVRRTLDEDEVETINLIVSNGKRGGARRSLIISEPGLYRLMMRSDKAEARPFQRFVTREVLPAIRKRGAYMTQDTAQRVINDAQEGVRIAHEQLAETRRQCQSDCLWVRTAAQMSTAPRFDTQFESQFRQRPTKPRTAGASSFLDPTCPHAFSRPGSMNARPSR